MEHKSNQNIITIFRTVGRLLIFALFLCGAQICGNIVAHASSIAFVADSGKTTKEERAALRAARRRAHALKENRNANINAANSDLKTGHVKAAKEAETLATKDEQKLKAVRKNIRKDKKAIKKNKTVKDDWGG